MLLVLLRVLVRRPQKKVKGGTHCKSRASHTVEVTPEPNFPIAWYLLLKTSPIRAG